MLDESVRAGLRQALRRLLILLGLLVLGGALLVVASFESEPLYYRKSPLRWIDPSFGGFDTSLRDALVVALAGQARPQSEPGDAYGADLALSGVMGDADFKSRVDTVPGWDCLVVFQPYQRGSELPGDPAITSWWLKRQLDHTEGPPTEQYCDVLLIRAQQSVGVVRVRGALETSGLVKRSR